MPRPAVRRAGRAAARLAGVATTLALAGCSPGDNDPGADGVSAGEARALDEAAEMLDERRLPDQPTATSSPDADATAQAGDR